MAAIFGSWQSRAVADDVKPTNTGSNTTTSKSAVPRLHVTTPRHDFGQIWAGPAVEHAFELKNEGDGDLEILHVQPTCGCTTAGDFQKRIAPGKSGIIPFRLDSNKVHGVFSKAIHVTTNDPAAPTVELTLAGECRRRVEAKPPNAGFGRILDQEPHERVVILTNTMPAPIKPEMVRGSGPQPFKCRLDEIKAGREYRLTVRVEPPYSPGTLTETLKIKTGEGDTDIITVSAYAVVPKRVEVFPSVVLLPTATAMARATAPTIRQLQFLNHGDKPVKLIEAASNDPAVKVTQSPSSTGKEHKIKVEVGPGYQPSAAGSSILVRTDDTEFKEFTIPIRLTGQTTPSAGAGAQGGRAGASTGADATVMKITENSKPRSNAPRPAMTMLNQKSPEFELETLSGQPISPMGYRDHPATVLNFVAPNCGFCKRQLPEVEKVREAFAPRGVRFVNVMQTMRQTFTQEQILEALATAKSQSEVSLDAGNAVGAKFKATSFPSLYVIDSAGMIREVVSGAKKDTVQTLTRSLEDLLTSELAQEKPAEPPHGESP